MGVAATHLILYPNSELHTLKKGSSVTKLHWWNSAKEKKKSIMRPDYWKLKVSFLAYI